MNELNLLARRHNASALPTFPPLPREVEIPDLLDRAGNPERGQDNLQSRAE